jgi:hypothetical protein
LDGTAILVGPIADTASEFDRDTHIAATRIAFLAHLYMDS